MLEKLKKHKFIVGVILLSLIYFILTNVQNAVFIYGDNLHEYSLFVKISNVIGLTLTQAHFMFYIFASILFIYSLKSLVKNDFVKLIIFFVVLFNPIIYSANLLEDTKYSFYPSLMLISISGIFGIILNYNKKSKKALIYLIPILICCFIILAVCLLNRVNITKSFDKPIENLYENFKHQAKLDNITIKAQVDDYYLRDLSDEEDKEHDEFVEMTGSVGTTLLSYNYRIDKIKIIFLELIFKLYEILGKPIILISLLIYCFMIIRFFILKPRFSNYKELLILTGLILLYFIKLILITFSHGATTDVINFSSTYSLQFIFEILAIVFGITEVKKIKKIKSSKN